MVIAPMLMVDDQPEDRAAFAEALSAVGCELRFTKPGEPDFAEAIAGEHAVVLVALEADRESLEIVAMVRAAGEVPIMLVPTREADASVATKAYDLGVADVVSRPIDPRVIAAKAQVFCDLFNSRKRATDLLERLRRLQSVTAALTRANSAVDVADVMTSEAFAAFGADTCTLYVAEEDRVVLVGHRGVPTPVLGSISVIGRGSALDRLSTPLFVETAAGYRQHFPEVASIPSSEKRAQSFWSLPLHACGRFVGVLGMGFHHEQTFDDDQRAYITTLAQQCASALDRARTTDDERARNDRLRIAASASRALGSSIEYETTLSNIAHSLVPNIGDWCSIDLVDEAGAIQLAALAHVDPAKIEMGHELRSAYPPREGAAGLYRVLRGGGSELYSEITDAMLVATALDEKHLAVLRALGMAAVMMVPLRVRDRILGVLTLVSANLERRYGPADLALFEDIGARAALAIDNARLHERARRAVVLRDDFMTIASHELRTPLATLKLRTQRMLRRAMEPDEVRKQIQQIDGQADRLDALVSRLLDVSRLSVDRPLDLTRTLVDLGALVTSVAGEMAETLEKAGVALTLDAQSVSLAVDDVRVRELVANLIGNAAIYAAGAPLSITLMKTATGAALVVADSGPGIAVADRERVFQRFERASSDRHGFGLGLWLCRRIAEAHGGSIRIESTRAPGTTFVVELPSGAEGD